MCPACPHLEPTPCCQGSSQAVGSDVGEFGCALWDEELMCFIDGTVADGDEDTDTGNERKGPGGRLYPERTTGQHSQNAKLHGMYEFVVDPYARERLPWYRREGEEAGRVAYQ